MQLQASQSSRPRLEPGRWLADHGDYLWRFAVARVRGPDAAEELVQEALVAALESAPRFRGDSSERTWLTSILQRKIADYIRRRGRPVASLDASSADTESLFDERGRWRVDPGRSPRHPNAVLADPVFRAELDRCLALLPAGVRDALVLREARGVPASAVCGELGITERNLWVRIHRARVLLRACLWRLWSPG